MKKSFLLLLVALVSLALACNFSVPSSTPATPAPPSVGGTAQLPTQAPGGEALPPPLETVVSSQPVPMREGLASLDSFVLLVRIVSTGPTAQDRSEMSYEYTYSDADDANILRTTTSSASADSPEPTTSDSDTYNIGVQSCTVSDDDYSMDEMSPMEKELQGVFAHLVDLTPIIADPVFVGEETINGVATNHFTFQLSGLGAESGALVTTNQGEYWVAQDGQYLVKYTLQVEEREEADGTFMGIDQTIELSSINQPVQIAFPEGCQ